MIAAAATRPGRLLIGYAFSTVTIAASGYVASATIIASVSPLTQGKSRRIVKVHQVTECRQVAPPQSTRAKDYRRSGCDGGGKRNADPARRRLASAVPRTPAPGYQRDRRSVLRHRCPDTDASAEDRCRDAGRYERTEGANERRRGPEHRACQLRVASLVLPAGLADGSLSIGMEFADLSGMVGRC